MHASLQFRDYQVTNITYRFNPFIDLGESEELIPDFDYDLKFENDQTDSCWVTVIFKIGDPALTKSSLFLEASVTGFFEVTGIDAYDEKINFYKVNALAILFPFLRSLVADVTSKGSEAPLIIPTLNIVALIQEKEQKILEEKANHAD